MPFIDSLQKNIWALYIPPYPDELFSSWYLRLTQAHAVKSHSFARYYFPGQQFWTRDVDNMPTDYLRKIIFDSTPLTYNIIESLFLTSYQSFLFENHNPNGFTSGILPLGIVHRKRKHKGLLYCPDCLKNNPYYKKKWRLTISYVCCDCGVLLKDCCPECKNPIVFHRLEQGDKNKVTILSLSLCSHCNYDLTENSEKATEIQLLNQSNINNILQVGYSNHIQYSFNYFYLFQNIMNLLSRRNQTWGRLRKACESEFGFLPEKDKNLYFWSIEERLPLFEITCKIINDYSFLKYLIVNYNLRLSEFSKDYKLPYSFEKIFKDY